MRNQNQGVLRERGEEVRALQETTSRRERQLPGIRRELNTNAEIGDHFERNTQLGFRWSTILTVVDRRELSAPINLSHEFMRKLSSWDAINAAPRLCGLLGTLPRRDNCLIDLMRHFAVARARAKDNSQRLL
jgi:hypothetical protein